MTDSGGGVVKKSKLSFIKRTSQRALSSPVTPSNPTTTTTVVRDRSASSADDSLSPHAGGANAANVTSSSAAILALYEEDGTMSSLALLAECLRRSQQSSSLAYDEEHAGLEPLDEVDGDNDGDSRCTVHFLLRGFVVDAVAALDTAGEVADDADLIAACRKKLGSHLQFKVLRLTTNRCALLLPHAPGDDNPLRLATLSELADENVRLRHWLAATGDGRAALKELQDAFDQSASARRRTRAADDDGGGGASDDEAADEPPKSSAAAAAADDDTDEAAYERVLQRKFEAEAELAAWKELLAQAE